METADPKSSSLNERIASLYASGYTYHEIAAALGISVHKVKYRICYYVPKKRRAYSAKEPAWTPERIKRLHELLALGCTHKQAAIVLGVSAGAVKYAVGRTREHIATVREWPDVRKMEFREMYADGMPIAYIAAQFGVNERTVNVLAKRWKVQRSKKYLTSRDVAKLLGLCSQTVINHMARGRLRAMSHTSNNGRVVRFCTYPDVLAFLDNKRYWHYWRPEQLQETELRRIYSEIRQSEPWISIYEAAEILYLHPETVRQQAKRGLFRYRVRTKQRHMYVLRSEVLHAKETQKIAFQLATNSGSTTNNLG